MGSAVSISVRAVLGALPTEVSHSELGLSKAGEEEFCRHLERLSAWKRRHMPVLNMPQGTDVLVWLFKGGVRIRPLKDLYRGSRFSEPTMRLVLKALVDDGFIAIDRNPDDLRVRTVLLTPKLVEAVRAYLQLLRDCATSFAQADPPGFGDTAIDISYATFDHAA